jgi:hypothetical protein
MRYMLLTLNCGRRMLSLKRAGNWCLRLALATLRERGFLDMTTALTGGWSTILITGLYRLNAYRAEPVFKGNKHVHIGPDYSNYITLPIIPALEANENWHRVKGQRPRVKHTGPWPFCPCFTPSHMFFRNFTPPCSSGFISFHIPNG